MKLRTEMLDIGGQMRLATFYGCGDSGGPQEAISHDALAAHALLQAMEENDMDGWDYNANVVAIVRERADGLMREWTGQ